MNVSDILGLLTLCLACFLAGYGIGKDNNTRK